MATIIGTDDPETLDGTTDADSIDALGGGDKVNGDDGDDSVDGGDGNDGIDGGAGMDTLHGGAGNDYFIVNRLADIVAGELYDGGAGDDTVFLNYNSDSDVSGAELTGIEELNQTYFNFDTGLTAAQLDALLRVSGSSFTLTTGGAVSMNGTTINANSFTLSGAGNVFDLTGATQSYLLTVNGAGGDDSITGGANGDTLNGGGGADMLDGAAGIDTMRGGAGDDVYVVDEAGDRTLENAGAGTDTVLSAVSLTLRAEIENLTLTGGAPIDGAGNELGNILTGNSAANLLVGKNGYDTLDGGAGADQMRGGRCSDIYWVDDAGDKVIEIAGQGHNDTVNSSVTFSLAGQSIEVLNLVGAAAIDGLGNGLDNRMTGNSADNSLAGGDGNDALHGGLGDDTLVGGRGHDSYWFETALGAGNVDTITGFKAVDDTLYLDRSIFTGIAADGALAAGAFRMGSAALDADDRILYDKVNGDLYYDADGAGGAAAVQFAHVAGSPSMTAADFFAVA